MKTGKLISAIKVIPAILAIGLLIAALGWAQDSQPTPLRPGPPETVSVDSGASPASQQNAAPVAVDRTGAQNGTLSGATPIASEKSSPQTAKRRSPPSSADRPRNAKAPNRRGISPSGAGAGASIARADDALLTTTQQGSAVSAGADADSVSAVVEGPPPLPAAEVNSVPTPAPDSSAAPHAESSAPKSAQQTQNDRPEAVPTAPDFALIKAAGGFGLVLSLMALAYFGARKYFPQHFAPRTSEKSLKLIETLSVGEKRSVAVIEFNSQRFLVGNTPNQITLLAALPGELLPAGEVPPATTAPSFELSSAKVTSESFRNLYEVEKSNGRGNGKSLPPDIRAKMRQLRESLER